jgi:hypothetical protein
MVSRFYGQVRQKYEKNHYGEQKEKSKVDFQPYSHLVAGSRIELASSLSIASMSMRCVGIF